jgi:hypothetical protein
MKDGKLADDVKDFLKEEGVSQSRINDIEKRAKECCSEKEGSFAVNIMIGRNAKQTNVLFL